MRKLKYKFVLTLLLSSTLPLVILGGVSIALMHGMAINSAQQRINADLRIASTVYQATLESLKFSVRDQNRRLATLIQEDQIDLLRNEFVKTVKENKFDFFVVTDDFGKVLVSLPDTGMEGYNFSRDYFVRQALRFGVTVTADVLDEPMIKLMGLGKKAQIPGMQPAQALVLRSCIPLINTNEIIVGTLTAGYVLNNNNPAVVDRVTEGQDLVASLFLGDIRVSSNVSNPCGMTTLGTKVEGEVAGPLLAGSTGNVVSFVTICGIRYLAGYIPLLNYREEPIGILGIGIPSSNIFSLRDRIISLFCLAVLLSVVLSFLLGFLRGNSIVRSVTKFRAGIEAFAQNKLDVRIDVDSGDEIEELADFFNQTMQRLKETRKALETCTRNADHLRDKVMESSVQLEEAHKQLVEYERLAAMGRMGTVINHELRNIFAEIQGHLVFLKEEVEVNYPRGVERIVQIEQGLNYATEVLSSVLRLSYPKKLSVSDVDIKVLIEDLVALPNIKNLTSQNNVKVFVKTEEGLPSVTADGLQLREVVSILAVNAVQAMAPAGGKLIIDARREQDWLQLSVSDTGPGMPAAVLENLFTPFFTTKNRGLGLGLCISREIVKAHKGSIEVTSEAGRGTTFLIKIPLKGRV